MHKRSEYIIELGTVCTHCENTLQCLLLFFVCKTNECISIRKNCVRECFIDGDGNVKRIVVSTKRTSSHEFQITQEPRVRARAREPERTKKKEYLIANTSSQAIDVNRAEKKKRSSWRRHLSFALSVAALRVLYLGNHSAPQNHNKHDIYNTL